MKEGLLFNPDGPAVSVLAATPSTVANHLMAWTPAYPQWDIRRVRGTKSSDEQRFFDELAAALQFPYYFGENWNAVWDCVTDLSWLKGSKLSCRLRIGGSAALGVGPSIRALATSAHRCT